MAELTKHKRTLTTQTLTSGQLNTYKLPRDYYIQKVFLYFTLTYTNGATAPTLIEDAPFTIIKHLRLKTAGWKNITLVDVTPKSFISLMKLEHKIGLYYEALDTTASTQFTKHFVLDLDFVINRLDSYDVSAVIPAFTFSSLTLELDVGDGNDLASANPPTIDSITVAPTLTEIISDQEIATLDYYLISRELSIANQLDLETGLSLRRLMLLVKDSSGDRSDSIVSKYNVYTGKTPIIPDTEFLHSKLMDRQEYGISPDTGVTMVDFANINDIQGMLDLTQAKEGDVKLGLTYSGSGSIELLYNWIG